MADVQSGKVQGHRVPADNSTAQRTESGAYAVPAGTPLHVHDRRVEVSQYVMRELLRNALGESYTYELVPMAVQHPVLNERPSVNVGYMLAVCTRSGLVGSDQNWLHVTSKPFDYMMPETGIQEIVRACVGELRKARARMLSER